MTESNLFYYIENLFELPPTLIAPFLLFGIFFILVFISVQKTIFKEKNQRGIAVIIALCISILSVVYLTQTQLEFILTVYQKGGFIIRFIIPFIIVLGLSHNKRVTPKIRKLIITIFGATLIYLSRKNELLTSNTTLISIGIILLALILDSKINQIMHKRNPKVY